ncbi:lipocalin Cav p 2.0101-like [Sorex fumeus]|uniref:lipocalin Cav p 2.0101-like n=1 Tax=Sorex fumeus TaxID=62283 RepID=UPI0024AD1254|nr:lipocalin Cav p 2.0101-like [Sorex fumeus]
MKFVLLALFVAVASANLKHEHTGQWRMVSLASNNIEKIQENGELRGFLRDISCEGVDCDSVSLNFWMKNNEQCEKFSLVGNKAEGSEDYNTDFSGHNFFRFCHQSENLLVICIQNTDVNGLVTHLVDAAAAKLHKDSLEYECVRSFRVRPGHKFNEADRKVYRQLVKQQGIDKENIVNVESADTCPH